MRISSFLWRFNPLLSPKILITSIASNYGWDITVAAWTLYGVHIIKYKRATSVFLKAKPVLETCA